MYRLAWATGQWRNKLGYLERAEAAIYNGKQYGNQSKPRVTNALPGQSLHNYRLAEDYFLVSDDGIKAIWTVNTKWRRVG